MSRGARLGGWCAGSLRVPRLVVGRTEDGGVTGECAGCFCRLRMQLGGAVYLIPQHVRSAPAPRRSRTDPRQASMFGRRPID